MCDNSLSSYIENQQLVTYQKGDISKKRKADIWIKRLQQQNNNVIKLAFVI